MPGHTRLLQSPTPRKPRGASPLPPTAMAMFRPLSLAFSMTLLLAGCAGSMPVAEPADSPNADSGKVLGSMILPPGATIVQDKETLILGDGSSWVGRVTLSVAQPPLQVAAAFRDSFSRGGWVLQSSLTSETSILVFSKDARTATLEISADGGWIGKSSRVRITISPRPAAARPPADIPAAR